MHGNGQIRSLVQFSDGKCEGPQTRLYINGQKQREETHKDGKLMSIVAWQPNGEKCPVTNLKDGNGVSVRYNDDGTEDGRLTYKDGEEVID